MKEMETLEDYNKKYVGKRVEYAGGLYEVVRLYDLFGAWMVDIYDEPPSKHVDTVNFKNVKFIPDANPSN